MAYIELSDLRGYLKIDDRDTFATTDVDTTNDTITLSNVAFVNQKLNTAKEVEFESSQATADLPAPLAEDTIYYVILDADQVIQVATTSANAEAGTAISLTDTGTGTHTIKLADNEDTLLSACINRAQRAIATYTNRRFDDIQVFGPADVSVVADRIALPETFIDELRTGDMAGFTSAEAPADLPDPLVEGTIYYVIVISDTRIELATSLADAEAGTSLTITDSGSGTHRIIILETRYYQGDAVDGLWLWLDDDLAKLYEIDNGDSSGTAVSTDDVTLWPRNHGPPYYKIRLNSSSTSTWNVDTDYYIQVRGKWGYSICPPADIVQACIRWAAYLYRQKDTGQFENVAVGEGGTLRVPMGMPEDVRVLLDPYRRHTL